MKMWIPVIICKDFVIIVGGGRGDWEAQSLWLPARDLAYSTTSGSGVKRCFQQGGCKYNCMQSAQKIFWITQYAFKPLC